MFHFLEKHRWIIFIRCVEKSFLFQGDRLFFKNRYTVIVCFFILSNYLCVTWLKKDCVCVCVFEHSSRHNVCARPEQSRDSIGPEQGLCEVSAFVCLFDWLAGMGNCAFLFEKRRIVMPIVAWNAKSAGADDGFWRNVRDPVTSWILGGAWYVSWKCESGLTSWCKGCI